jgi:hypothetical protein
MTEAGFVRIVSNPAISQEAPTPIEALRGLEVSLKHPAHQFWPDDLTLAGALAEFGSRQVEHQQITDAYLLALAIHHNGKLATLDGRLARSLTDKGNQRAHVELVAFWRTELPTQVAILYSLHNTCYRTFHLRVVQAFHPKSLGANLIPHAPLSSLCCRRSIDFVSNPLVPLCDLGSFQH